MPKRANGEGSIYRRKDGRYCAALLVDGRRRMVYGASREEVSKRLTTLVKAREDGVALPVGRQTVAAFALVWLEGTRSTLRPRTWERYEQFVRWHDVDCDRAAPSVTGTVQRTRRDGLVLAEPTTTKSRRRVALTAGAVDALRRHRVGQAAERLQAPDWSELDLVFPNRLGRFQEPTRMAHEYRKLLTAAGLPRLRFHDLRHTAATLMLARGVHPKVASEMLGHSSIGITLDLYSHVTETMQREAAASLDQLLWS